MSDHVDIARSEHKNDIISNNTSISTVLQKKATHVVLLPPSMPVPNDSAPSCATNDTTSQLKALSSSTTSRTHQQRDPPLCPDLVQTFIQASVAAMGEERRKTLERGNSKREHEEDEQPSNMSVDDLASSKKPRRKRTSQAKEGQTSGRWTQQEHQAFLEGLRECGREWKKVAMRIPTRTSAQIRSHAQKYFSKIQRDHESAILPDLSASYSSAGPASSIHSADNQSLAPSVQRNVERILANPLAMQQEVESTLEALRERYRQLQLRLEQRQEQRRARRDSSRDTNQRHHVPDDEAQISSQFGSRKRNFADHPARPRVASFSSSSHDDHSTISSNVSPSVASMGNDELIALHVLGGALPRGDSNPDLERLAVLASHSSDISMASSTATDQNHPDELGNEHHHDCSPQRSCEDPISKRPKSK